MFTFNEEGSYVEGSVSDTELLAAAQEVVTERGEDWVYPREDTNDTRWLTDGADGGLGCRYVAWTVGDGNSEVPEPGCIVGAILNRVGVPLEWLDSWEGQPAYRLVDRLRMSGRQSGWLDAMQFQQDNRRSWGAALAYANVTCPLEG